MLKTEKRLLCAQAGKFLLQVRDFVLEQFHFEGYLVKRCFQRACRLFECLEAFGDQPWAPRPVTASIRRTFAATELSLTMMNTPISDVRSRCVPPHSS